MPSDVERAIDVLEFIHGEDTLPKERLLSWLRSTDPDVLGAVYVAASSYWSRVEPPITRMEFGRLLGRILSAGLRSKGRTNFSMSKYEAARTFGGWMLECFRDRTQDRDAERCLKWAVSFLASLYKSGNAKDRRCLVDGAIEHLFEVEGVDEYFKSWKRDRILRRAHREATEWARDPDSGGHAMGILQDKV